MPRQLSWLSFLLLVLTYATFGQFLHIIEAPQWVWLFVAALALLQACCFTFLWKVVRDIVLLGFSSDIGYTIMVLSVAILVVAALVHLQLFVYGLVIISAFLLVRMDTLLLDLPSSLAFVILAILPLLGLGASWFFPVASIMALLSHGVGGHSGTEVITPHTH